jgi:hypothetical protein
VRGLSTAPEPVMWVDVYYWKVSTSRFTEYKLVNIIVTSEG